MSEEIKPDELLPDKTSVDWNDFVMSHFADNELVHKDGKSYPLVNALRRVTQLLIGEVVQETVHTVQAPTEQSGWGATVQATVQIIQKDNDVILTFSAVADSSSSNTDPGFRMFPSSMAETRAVGRAFRKALALSTVSYEELSKVADEDRNNVRADSNDLKIFRKACENKDLNAKEVLEKHGLTESNVTKSKIQELIKEVQTGESN